MTNDELEAINIKASHIYMQEWVLTESGRSRFGKKNTIKALEFLADKFDQLLGTGWRDYLLDQHKPKPKKIHAGEYD